MELKDAISTRFSARGFLNTPISQDVIADILRLASRAPSGSNMQPWKVAVVSGSAMKTVVDACLSSMNQDTQEELEYALYPSNLSEIHNARRFETGMTLYKALGIGQKDKEKRQAQLLENFRFFGAPVGLFFSIDKMFIPGQLGDLGMFIQNVMLLAREHGLHTCPQAAWQLVNRTVHRELDIPDEEMIYCGMAMGYLDTQHPANSFKLERVSIETYTRFMGFED